VAKLLTEMQVNVKAAFIGAIFPPRQKGAFGRLQKSRRKNGGEKHALRYLKQAGVPSDLLADERFFYICAMSSDMIPRALTLY
jgi:hypothetical protein